VIASVAPGNIRLIGAQVTNLYRVRVGLSGFPGGPGVSTFFFFDVATAIDSLHSLYTSVAPYMPAIVRINVETTGDVITDTNGAITSAWSHASVAEIAGSNPNPYAGPAGALFVWKTAVILDRKRLRGRTFIVPMTTDKYQNDGSLADGPRGELQGFVNAFTAEQSASFAVWHRPRKAKAADGSRPAITARDGGSALVVDGVVNDRICVLTSRRG